MKILFALLGLGLILALVRFVFCGREVCGWAASAAEPGQNVHSYTVQSIDGQGVDLSSYKGKALLIVNTASRCGFTPQYEGLEALYKKYQSRGFEVLGFPANNFLGQEPGTDAEIKEFCSLKFKTTFPLFSKISVKGKDIAPLFKYLTQAGPKPGAVTWNFNKFLIDPDGNLRARFGSNTNPQDPALVKALEEILP